MYPSLDGNVTDIVRFNSLSSFLSLPVQNRLPDRFRGAELQGVTDNYLLSGDIRQCIAGLFMCN